MTPCRGPRQRERKRERTEAQKKKKIDKKSIKMYIGIQRRGICSPKFLLKKKKKKKK